MDSPLKAVFKVETTELQNYILICWNHFKVLSIPELLINLKRTLR